MINGQMLVEKESVRLVITIVIVGAGSVQIEAGEEHHELVKKLIQDIADFSKEHKFLQSEKDQLWWRDILLERGANGLGFRCPGSRHEKGNTLEHHRFFEKLRPISKVRCTTQERYYIGW